MAQLKDDDGALLTLQSSWANRHWCSCVANILASLQDPGAMSSLKLDVIQDDKEESKSKTELFTKLVIRAASIRTWHSAFWSELPPENWSGILSPDANDANQALAKMYDDAMRVRQAVDALHQERQHPEKEAPQLPTMLLVKLDLPNLAALRRA